jgi:hypothetical protein
MDIDKHSHIGLTTDQEFASICPPLSSEEEAALKIMLKRDGCREPILFWESEGKKLIVDGHQRYRLCIELGVLYSARSMEFKDRYEVLVWMGQNQEGRRNLTPVGKNMMIGRIQAALSSRTQITQPSICPTEGQIESSNTRPAIYTERGIADQVAKDTGVTKKRVHQAVSITKSIDRLGKKAPRLKEKAIAGNIDQKDAVELSNAPSEVLNALAATPNTDIRAAAKAAATILRESRQNKIASGRPIVAVPALATLEKKIGEFVRGKSEALMACRQAFCPESCLAPHHDGENCPHCIAWTKFEGELRHCLNEAFEIIHAWQEKAQAAKKVA